MSQRPLPVLLPLPPNARRPGDVPPPKPLPKIRRALLACANCKKRKVKCNGARPVCLTCQQTNAECSYPIPEGLTRSQHERQKIQRIEQTNSSLSSVVELLRHGNEADSAVVLRRIREADSVDEAVDTVVVAQTLLGQASATGETSTAGHSRPTKRRLTSLFHHPDYAFEQQYARPQDQYIDPDIFVDLSTPAIDFSKWTTASNDNRLMNNILTLFWTWDNIVEKILYRPMFEEDAIRGDPNSDPPEDHQFCSPFLVNALLALGCLYSVDTATFSDSNDRKTRGRRFAEEAEKCFQKEKLRPSIALLQGQYALFCYEGNLGLGVKSVDYFARSVATFKQLNTPEFLAPRGEGKSEARLKQELEGMSWAMWGFYVTEWRSSQAFGHRKSGRKPDIPKLWQKEDFPLSKPETSGYWWYPFPMSLQSQPSMKVELREVDVALSEIAEEVCDLVGFDPNLKTKPPTDNPQYAIKLYNDLVLWKLTLPPRIRSEEAVLPAAILLHCSVEVLCTAILRPFSNFTKQEFGPFDPKHRCLEHTSSLQSAIWTFRAFSVLRHEYWLCHAISTSAFLTIHGQDHAPSPTQIDTLIKACQCLHEMGDTLPLAIDCLSAIHGAFKRKGNMPRYMERFFGVGLAFRKDGLMHHAVAALMPGEEDREAKEEMVKGLALQELLNELDGMGID